ncbi:MAG: 2-hydroxyacid dehydrogenase [Coriobacteriia bacterium]|nr:2-hydroxyacid dehydrogenase [Coriobacteriia bacterium]
MKMLVIGDEQRTRRYLPDLPVVGRTELVVVPRGTSDAQILAEHGDADYIMADAISPVSAELIAGLPNLKLIHSEGVAFNAIDCNAAAERGIPVCNNAGVNAGAVAEQAILLMLGCLRGVVAGDVAVRAGQQIQTKERLMVQGIRELGDCTVGLIGFGAIARATAERLRPFGCRLLYNKRSRLAPEEEERLGVAYASVDEIAAQADIVSLHCPVTPQTTDLVDAAFLEAMKPDAILINTARGEVVDQVALARALEQGQIGMAGLDTLSPEPVQTDHPLLTAGPAVAERVLLSPHVGGVTEGMFYRAHRWVWENVARVEAGERPVNVVNGL